MLYNYINKDQLEQNPNLEGYYKYDIDENTYFIGKLKNSKRNGYGTIYQNGQIIWDGMWMDDEKIDDLLLPNEVQIDEPELVLDSCQKLVFHIKANDTMHNFKFTYSVPSVHIYNLHKTINKAINHANFYNNNNISVNVYNRECNLSNKIIRKLLEIDNIASYITNLDYECSSCKNFNRGWVCCGQFAPFLYMYYFLLYENNYETHYKNKFDQSDLQKPSQIYNIANVFYKMFTGYADTTDEYNRLRNKLLDMYNTNIPNHIEYINYWNLEDFNLNNHTSYLMLLTNDENVAHYCYIYRQDTYVILCDSWSHRSDKRNYTPRIMNYSDFIKCITKINKLYHKMMVYIDSDRDYSKLLMLYNFILDSLFLVPYNKSDIDNSEVNFYRNLFYIAIIDPQKVRNALDLLDENSGEPFNLYYTLGGSRALIKKSKRLKTAFSTNKKTRTTKKQYYKARFARTIKPLLLK